MNDQFPARRDYKPEVLTTPMSELPFVNWPGRKGKKAEHSNWSVPAVDDYVMACNLGREYAAHYIQYLKDNPGCMSVLGHIAASINFEDRSNTVGCWVGFFEYLERLLIAQARQMNVFEDVDLIKARYADQKANATPGEAS